MIKLLLGFVVLGFGVVAQAATIHQTTSTVTRIDAGEIVAGAREEAQRHTIYLEQYHVLNYPGGDVPAGTGVCTDLVIRAFRNAGVDIQKELHEDRVAHPEVYPTKIWDNKKPDKNIDHRRCQNMAAWFARFACKLPIALDNGSIEKNWRAGDVVFYVREKQTYPWHVAIVSDRKAADGMPMIIDGYPPYTSETHRLDEFKPIHSHWRMERRPGSPNPA